MKKKRRFCKTFRSLGNVLELQFLLDDLFRMINVYQWFFTLNILVNEVYRTLGYEVKKIVR